LKYTDCRWWTVPCSTVEERVSYIGAMNSTAVRMHTTEDCTARDSGVIQIY